MDPSKTLWMGNLEQGTNHNFIEKLFNKLSKKNLNILLIIIDIKILNTRILFKKENKKGSAFVEFETSEIAQKILKDYNGKIVNGHLLKLNWTKLNTKNIKDKKESKIYTVIKILIIYILFVQLYIGNLDIEIKEEELLSILKSKFKSVVSCKIIYDLYNNISKGFGFVDLSDINEYNDILKSKEKIIIRGKQINIK